MNNSIQDSLKTAGVWAATTAPEILPLDQMPTNTGDLLETTSYIAAILMTIQTIWQRWRQRRKERKAAKQQG